MDFSSLREQVSNLTMYDLKAGVRKVQNGKLRPLLYPPGKSGTAGLVRCDQEG